MMVETLLRWSGHVERRLVDSVVRRVDKMKISQITRGRGRPRKTIRETKVKRLISWIELEIRYMIEYYDIVLSGFI